MNDVTDMYRKSIFLVEHHSVVDSGLFRKVTTFFKASPERVKAYNIGGIIVTVSLLSAQLRFVK